jgi:hypothetical protein
VGTLPSVERILGEVFGRRPGVRESARVIARG